MGRLIRTLNTGLDLATWIVLALVVWFVLRSRQVLRPPGGPPVASYTSKDSLLPRIALVDTSRGITSLDAITPRPRTLVFVFRSDCHACGAQQSDWAKLNDIAQQRGIGVIAVTPESMSPEVAGYFGRSRVATYSLKHPEAIVSGLGTSMVPTTLVIDGRKIIYHHIGLLQSGDLDGLSLAISSAVVGEGAASKGT